MGPVSAEIEIDVSRERAYEELSDLSRRPYFMDHFISEPRLTRIDPEGVGAGARFRFDMPIRKVWMDTTIVEVDPPARIVERGFGGRVNRIPSTTVWELRDGPGTLITVRVTYMAAASHPVDRVLDAATGANFWHERGWREALRRLRDRLESDAENDAPIRVAGGNAHLTGIP